MDEKELFAAGPRDGRSGPRGDLNEEQLAELRKPLDERRIERRKAKLGTVEYLPTWDVINRANEIFGYGGWGREIIRLEKVYEEELEGTYTVGYLCESRVVVGETVHEDVGFGSAVNYPDPTAAHEKAMKGAVSDSLKRCLRAFGPQFGLSLYRSAERREVEEGEGHEPGRGITEKQLARLRRELKVHGLEEADLVEYINLKMGTEYAGLEELSLRLASRAITRFSEEGPAFAKEIRQAL